MSLGNTLNILRPPERSTPPVQTQWNDELVKNMHNVLGQLSQQITSQPFGGLPQGTARPSFVGANTFWLDITSATAPIVKLFDGTDDIAVMTFDYTTNTVTFAGVSFDLVDDPSPQLGGDLDLNGNVITGLEIGTDVQAFLAAVTGDIIYASGTDTWAALAKDTDGMFLKQVSGIPAWATVPPGITRYSAIATTSGSTHVFTAIPAGTNRLTVMLDQVSLSGSNELLIQLGTASSFETSGYRSRSSGGTTGSGDITAGFIASLIQAAGDKVSGLMTICRINGNTWVASGTTDDDNPTAVTSFAGRKDLAAELTRVRLTRTGSNTFDLGQVGMFSEV